MPYLFSYFVFKYLPSKYLCLMPIGVSISTGTGNLDPGVFKRGALAPCLTISNANSVLDDPFKELKSYMFLVPRREQRTISTTDEAITAILDL